MTTYPAETADEAAEAPPVTALPTLKADIRQMRFNQLSRNEVRTLKYRHQQRIPHPKYRRRQRIHQQTKKTRISCSFGKMGGIRELTVPAPATLPTAEVPAVTTLPAPDYTASLAQHSLHVNRGWTRTVTTLPTEAAPEVTVLNTPPAPLVI